MAEQKRIWDNFKEIGEVQKSASIKLTVSAGIRDGVKYVCIREFYWRKLDGTWNPSRDGITIPLMVPIKQGTELLTPCSQLLEIIAKTIDELDTMPLADENNAVYADKKEKKK